MDDDLWFSAKVRLAAVLDEDRVDSFMDCLHVFRAADWDEAFQRALALGRSHESEYRNADGERLRWRLAQVLTLDRVVGSLDGAEVFSESFAADQFRDDRSSDPFAPERSVPRQTI